MTGAMLFVRAVVYFKSANQETVCCVSTEVGQPAYNRKGGIL